MMRKALFSLVLWVLTSAHAASGADLLCSDADMSMPRVSRELQSDHRMVLESFGQNPAVSTFYNSLATLGFCRTSLYPRLVFDREVHPGGLRLKFFDLYYEFKKGAARFTYKERIQISVTQSALVLVYFNLPTVPGMKRGTVQMHNMHVPGDNSRLLHRLGFAAFPHYNNLDGPRMSRYFEKIDCEENEARGSTVCYVTKGSQRNPVEGPLAVQTVGLMRDLVATNLSSDHGISRYALYMVSLPVAAGGLEPVTFLVQ
jgi:hypothetical protein